MLIDKIGQRMVASFGVDGDTSDVRLPVYVYPHPPNANGGRYAIQVSGPDLEDYTDTIEYFLEAGSRSSEIVQLIDADIRRRIQRVKQTIERMASAKETITVSVHGEDEASDDGPEVTILRAAYSAEGARSAFSAFLRFCPVEKSSQVEISAVPLEWRQGRSLVDKAGGLFDRAADLFESKLGTYYVFMASAFGLFLGWILVKFSFGAWRRRNEEASMLQDDPEAAKATDYIIDEPDDDRDRGGS